MLLVALLVLHGALGTVPTVVAALAVMALVAAVIAWRRRLPPDRRN